MNLKSEFLLKDIKVWDGFGFGPGGGGVRSRSKRFLESVPNRLCFSVLEGRRLNFVYFWGRRLDFCRIWGGGWIFVGFRGGGWILVGLQNGRPSPPLRGESAAPKGCWMVVSGCATAVMRWRNKGGFSTLFGGQNNFEDPLGSPIQNLKGFGIKFQWIKGTDVRSTEV